MNTKKESINKAVARLVENYEQEELFAPQNMGYLPNRSEIIAITDELRNVIFPGYFGPNATAQAYPDHFVGYKLNDLYDRLKLQIQTALHYKNNTISSEEVGERAEKICAHFFESLPDVQTKLLKDVQAGFDGDPAAKGKEEVICSYPGLFAIYVYRLAHILYMDNVPQIPRIMTEYAHSETGIDINPGADIGEYFFIDHGTGVVIGETTVIGNNVKLYQGVTLGALSTRKGQLLSNTKRHPTLGDNVTIYANSTVLGGETVIGSNTTVAGNTFITESIAADTKVSSRNPELVIRGPQNEPVWYWQI